MLGWPGQWLKAITQLMVTVFIFKVYLDLPDFFGLFIGFYPVTCKRQDV